MRETSWSRPTTYQSRVSHTYACFETHAQFEVLHCQNQNRHGLGWQGRSLVEELIIEGLTSSWGYALSHGPMARAWWCVANVEGKQVGLTELQTFEVSRIRQEIVRNR